jgi:hypothetical protein
MEPIFKCPVCKGKIAFWVIRPRFTCHHCGWVLSSNVHAAISKSTIVGVGVEVVLLIGLWFWLGGFSSATLVWGAASGFLGFFAGWFALKQFLTLAPQARPVTSPLTYHSTGTR